MNSMTYSDLYPTPGGVPIEMPVLTNSGWVPAEKVNPNDFVLAYTGDEWEWVPVESVTVTPSSMLTLQSGYSFTMGAEVWQAPATSSVVYVPKVVPAPTAGHAGLVSAGESVEFLRKLNNGTIPAEIHAGDREQLLATHTASCTPGTEREGEMARAVLSTLTDVAALGLIAAQLGFSYNVFPTDNYWNMLFDKKTPPLEELNKFTATVRIQTSVTGFTFGYAVLVKLNSGKPLPYVVCGVAVISSAT
jgi:hypothetical protein